MPSVESVACGYLIGRDLYQTDYDFPSGAARCGWSIRRVQKRDGRAVHLSRVCKSPRNCAHTSTDGTVDCRECGVTSTEFIGFASEFLASKC